MNSACFWVFLLLLVLLIIISMPLPDRDAGKQTGQSKQQQTALEGCSASMYEGYVWQKSSGNLEVLLLVISEQDQETVECGAMKMIRSGELTFVTVLSNPA
jgi:hypothetical protein